MPQFGATCIINASPLPSTELFMPWDDREIYSPFSLILGTLYSIIVVIFYLYIVWPGQLFPLS